MAKLNGKLLMNAEKYQNLKKTFEDEMASKEITITSVTQENRDLKAELKLLKPKILYLRKLTNQIGQMLNDNIGYRKEIASNVATIAQLEERDTVLAQENQ